jgi:hypothetical protein
MLISVRKASEILGTNSANLYTLIRRGLLPAVTIDGRLMVDEKDLAFVVARPSINGANGTGK